MEPHYEQSESGQKGGPLVIPYAGSVDWYASWLRHRVEGLDDMMSCAAACADMHVDARALRRTVIAGHPPVGRFSGEGSMLLSVAVRKGEGYLLSGHGNWPRRHLGALNAVYGRTPYYSYLIDDIRGTLENTPESLSELNQAIHDIITSWIDIEAASKLLANRCISPAAHLGEQLKTFVNGSFSILDPLSRFGKNTTLILSR